MIFSDTVVPNWSKLQTFRKNPTELHNSCLVMKTVSLDLFSISLHTTILCAILTKNGRQLKIVHAINSLTCFCWTKTAAHNCLNSHGMRHVLLISSGGALTFVAACYGLFYRSVLNHLFSTWQLQTEREEVACVFWFTKDNQRNYFKSLDVISIHRTHSTAFVKAKWEFSLMFDRNIIDNNRVFPKWISLNLVNWQNPKIV